MPRKVSDLDTIAWYVLVLVELVVPDMTVFLRSGPRVGPARTGTLVLNGRSKQVGKPEHDSARTLDSVRREGVLCSVSDYS